MRAIVFCAGEGSCLRPQTWYIHKSCFFYKGVPLITALLREMQLSGVIESVIIAVGRLGDQVEESTRDVSLRIPVQFHDMGGTRGHALTIAEINRCHGLLSDDLFLIDGNIYVAADDIRGLVRMHRQGFSAFTIATRVGKMIEPSCHYAVRTRRNRIVELRHPSKNKPHGLAEGWRSCPSYYEISMRMIEFVDRAEAGWGMMWMAQELLRRGEVVGSYTHQGPYVHLAVREDLEKYSLKAPAWSPGNVSVRIVRPDDAVSIVTIFNQYIGKEYITVRRYPDSIARRRQSICSHMTFPQMVMIISGQIVGFCLGRPFSPRTRAPGIAELSIYIDQRLIGQGLGSILIQSFIQRARTMRFHKLVAWITSGNTRSERLFEKNGFRRVGIFQSHACICGHWIDRVCYERVLQ